jgi:hypothetical protein
MMMFVAWLAVIDWFIPVMDGLTVGPVGTTVGAGDGPAVDGETVGAADGDADDGFMVGSNVGRAVGDKVDGFMVGWADGDEVVGFAEVGTTVGTTDGSNCRVSLRMR